MADLVCEVCGRRYRSKSGLRRHMKAEHSRPVQRPADAVRPAAGEGEGEPADAVRGAAGGEAAALGVALRALGISRGDVMSYSVRGDRVVIIEGPVGYKRVWEAPGAKGGDDGGRAG
jgi:hypothetical protein